MLQPNRFPAFSTSQWNFTILNLMLWKLSRCALQTNRFQMDTFLVLFSFLFHLQTKDIVIDKTHVNLSVRLKEFFTKPFWHHFLSKVPWCFLRLLFFALNTSLYYMTNDLSFTDLYQIELVLVLSCRDVGLVHVLHWSVSFSWCCLCSFDKE